MATIPPKDAGCFYSPPDAVRIGARLHGRGPARITWSPATLLLGSSAFLPRPLEAYNLKQDTMTPDTEAGPFLGHDESSNYAATLSLPCCLTTRGVFPLDYENDTMQPFTLIFPLLDLRKALADPRSRRYPWLRPLVGSPAPAVEGRASASTTTKDGC